MSERPYLGTVISPGYAMIAAVMRECMNTAKHPQRRGSGPYICLGSHFCWVETPPGHAFWAKIYRNLRIIP